MLLLSIGSLAFLNRYFNYLNFAGLSAFLCAFQTGETETYRTKAFTSLEDGANFKVADSFLYGKDKNLLQTYQKPVSTSFCTGAPCTSSPLSSAPPQEPAHARDLALPVRRAAGSPEHWGTRLCIPGMWSWPIPTCLALRGAGHPRQPAPGLLPTRAQVCWEERAEHISAPDLLPFSP